MTLDELLGGGDVGGGYVGPGGVSGWDTFPGGSDVQPTGINVRGGSQLGTDPGQFNPFMDSVMGRIGGAYDFDMPEAETSLLSGAPQAQTNQFGISPELQSYLNGEGFSPQQLSMMNTQAREAPAMAGRQQLGQMKRMLGEAGIEGPAAAAMMGDVARNTGYAQNQNLQNVALGNAQQSAANKQFGIGQQSQIGLTNMQQANQMALQNASMMFQSLRDNQQQQNNMNQFNTGNKVNQQMSRAGQQGSFASGAGESAMGMSNQNAQQNQQNETQRDLTQAQYDVMPWQEKNARNAQSTNILGSWGQ